MSELTGSLIEMNAHMVMSKVAEATMFLGIVLGTICIAAIIAFLEDRKKYTKLIIVLSVILVFCLGAAFWGYNMPREKIIMACANGPISIERISTAYDILQIDGKMLKLRMR